MQKYIKKPVVIKAVRFVRDNFEEIKSFTNNTAFDFYIERSMNGKAYCTIPTLEGQHKATEGDYIIKGVKGEFYPCKPDIFEMTYELFEKKSGMYGEMPILKIGRYELSDMSNEPDSNSVWIDDIEDGDGGEFSKSDLEGIIEKYYNENH